MRYLALLSISVACILLFSLKPASFALSGKSPGDTSPVLAELYTSEGCSSCPPADILLAQLSADDEFKHVYFLSFHVDYWNRLGWKDPFSQGQFSARQQWYARKIDGAQVYTPQLIVNGTVQMVGSDKGKVTTSLRAFLVQSPRCHLTLQPEGNKLNYTIDGKFTNASLFTAIVTPNASTSVKAGENKGRFLKHTNVVRLLAETMRPAATGSVSLAERKPDELVFVWLQDKANGKVLAVAKL